MSDDTSRENAHEEETASPSPPADEVAAALLHMFAGSIFNESHGQPVVYVDRAVWHEVAAFLRDEQQFTMCLDVTAVDHLLDGVRYCPDGVAAERFEVVANFISHPRNRRIRVICEVPVAEPSVPSIVDLYPGMNFGEREAYDMFGIVFEGHPDLTRILMPDDWDGHPLRKDYPTARVPVTFKGDPSPR
ncbi:MAG: NADH:ubiquinone oxidoreductase 27 kD subunit [Actinomycetia bacterium]|nr:NADH:ubiquinone oxidoreductase 27 kD subunit [Actinomycetes bacterium]